jgi:response regulator NasT
MRILIAEDDPVIGLGLAQRLRALGHEPVGPEPDGQRALEQARATWPDLYLFDIDMPRLDGIEVAQRLAAEGLRRPVVVVTGVEDPGLVDRSIAAGIAAYLTKPINERELDAAIRLAAARHAELEALEAEVGRAQQVLEDRKVVERAKGLLVEALGVTEPEAFRRIQRAARDRNLRSVEVARKILEQQDLLRRALIWWEITSGPGGSLLHRDRVARGVPN